MRRLFLATALLALLPVAAHADDIVVSWVNATTWDDKSPLAADLLASTTAWCGLSASNLTLKASVAAPATSVRVTGASLGATYYCAAAHTLKDGNTSLLILADKPVTMPPPTPKRPSGPSSVSVTIAK